MKRIKLHPECISCFLDKHLGKYSDAPEEKRIVYMQSVLKILSEAPIYESAPEVIAKIEKLQCDMFGRNGNYDNIKHHFNSLMLTFLSFRSSLFSKSYFSAILERSRLQ